MFAYDRLLMHPSAQRQGLGFQIWTATKNSLAIICRLLRDLPRLPLFRFQIATEKLNGGVQPNERVS